MRPALDSPPHVVIACGGTGGHFFPGLAVGEVLAQRGCAITLLVSTKEIDQQATAGIRDLHIVSLPAAPFSDGQLGRFLGGCWRAGRCVRTLFVSRPPQVVLGMGGFTSVTPILLANQRRIPTYLHDSNVIPGRATRWLAWLVDGVFVGFAEAARRVLNQNVVHTGTPVRPQFQPADPAGARMALGLDPARPVLLVMGGSQGAHAVNELVLAALPTLQQQVPKLQFLHLAGSADLPRVREGYATAGIRAVVTAFLTEMELAMAAATVAVSRAGAASLAELAAMRLPAILIPYPYAADNHQLHNAQAFARTHAAVLLSQKETSAPQLASEIARLLEEPARIASMRQALDPWHHPQAAQTIAEHIGKHVHLAPAVMPLATAAAHWGGQR